MPGIGQLDKGVVYGALTYLERVYGKGRWRKMKGIATVQLSDGMCYEAEIHWFEAHGIGRKDFKIKRLIR